MDVPLLKLILKYLVASLMDDHNELTCGVVKDGANLNLDIATPIQGFLQKCNDVLSLNT